MEMMAAQTRQTAMQLRKAKRRRQMLDIAASLFARHGYYQTSTKFLGKHGDFSEGSFFSYFHSKDGILRAIHHELWAAIYAVAKASVRRHETPIEQITDFCDSLVDVLIEHADYARVAALTIYPAPTDAEQQSQADELSRSKYFDRVRRLTMRWMMTIAKSMNATKPRAVADVVFHFGMGSVAECVCRYRLQQRDESRVRTNFSPHDIKFILKRVVVLLLQTSEPHRQGPNG